MDATELLYVNTSCVKDGIMYPSDLILSHPYCESSGKGALVFHFLGVLYMFYG